MARNLRKIVDDGMYHVLNRGNCRMDIFEKPKDYAAFIKLLEEGRQRFDMRVLAYCLMRNHWHLVLWPRRSAQLSRFMQWVSTTHVRRWREHRANTGEGHLYQGRFKCFMVQHDEHLLTVLRYVEANPLRAGLVKRAKDWPWSSVSERPGSEAGEVGLTPWPVDRPSNWSQVVDQAIDARMLDQLRTSIARGRPVGSEKWVQAVAKRLGLESTVRDPWRPRKV